MRKIEKKVWPEYFQAILDGDKSLNFDWLKGSLKIGQKKTGISGRSKP